MSGRSQSTTTEICATCGSQRAEGAKKFKLCGRCRAVPYCGKECARRDWPSHKKTCKVSRPPREEEPSAIDPPEVQGSGIMFIGIDADASGAGGCPSPAAVIAAIPRESRLQMAQRLGESLVTKLRQSPPPRARILNDALQLRAVLSGLHASRGGAAAMADPSNSQLVNAAPFVCATINAATALRAAGLDGASLDLFRASAEAIAREPVSFDTTLILAVNGSKAMQAASMHADSPAEADDRFLEEAVRSSQAARTRLRADPDATATQRRRCDCTLIDALLWMRRSDEALPLQRALLAEEEVALGPGHADTVYSLTRIATVCYNTAQYEEAAATSVSALAHPAGLRVHDMHLTMLKTAADSLFMLQRFGEALPYYRKLAKVTSGDLRVPFESIRDAPRLVVQCLANVAWERAEQSYDEAAPYLDELERMLDHARVPSGQRVRYVRSLWTCASGKVSDAPEAALALVRRAQAMDPQLSALDRVLVAALAATVLERLGRGAEAMAEAECAIEGLPSFELYVDAIDVLGRVALLLEASSAAASTLWALPLLRKSLLALQSGELAVEDLAPMYRAAAAALQRVSLEDALELAREAVALTDDDQAEAPDEFVQCRLCAANLLSKMGRHGEAVSLLQHAVQEQERQGRKSQAGATHSALAEALRALGQDEEAERHRAQAQAIIAAELEAGAKPAEQQAPDADRMLQDLASLALQI